MMTVTERLKSHKALSFLVAFLLLIAAVTVGMRARQGKGDSLSEPLKKGAIMESVYGIGTVTATRSFQQKFGVMSTVQDIYIKEGDHVRSGQRLALMSDGLVLRAPFEGTVTFLPVKVGETVFPQSVILNLVDLADRYIVVSLEQRGALRVRQGQKAKISFDSMRGETFDGSVEAVYSNDNNFLVRIGVSNLPPQVLPGMTADVGIGIAERKDVLLIPSAALSGTKVRVKRGLGKPKEVDVTVGIVDGSMAEIASGDVDEGDRLVLQKPSGSAK